MPRCQTCTKYFSPTHMVVVNEEKNHYQCVFCKLEKNEITIVDDKTGREESLSREQAIRDYEELTRKLAKSDRVQNLTGKSSNIIKPY